MPVYPGAPTGRSAPVPRIGTLPLAVSAACGPPSRDQGATVAHFDWPSLSGRQVLLFHASACDELTPPIHRAPPGPHAGRFLAEGAPHRARHCPGTTHRSRFRCHRCFFRCVSSGSHTFVFSSHTCPAVSGTLAATLTTPALDRRSLRWFGISACTANPEGLSSITGTARLVLAIFYIVITSLSGHTWVPKTWSCR